MSVAESTQSGLERLALPAVLVAVGDLDAAEAEIGRLLDARPDDLEALGLLAKVKHIRGELSEAFACWARAHAGAPQGEAARMRLMSLLQLATDPERGAGEFLALGRDHLWRKPTSFLELERVFQLFVKRQPDEARAAAAQVARAYRDRDPEMFKLAVLAEALVAERTGDLEGARRVLEDFGRERGYEGDLDRALALVRIYEQLGGEENLERAANICHFLERTLGPVAEFSNLGRLAAIYRALGREGEAREYEERFLAAFRRRMYRPELADLSAAGAERYIPLPHLAAVRPSDTAVAAEWPLRQRALALALRGERQAARRLLTERFDVLDRKYLADLAAMEGDLETATQLFLGTLEDAIDAEVVGWLLDHATDGLVAAHFRNPAHAEAARAILDTALAERPLRPAPWRRHAALSRMLGELEEAERASARAAALEAARPRAAVGRSLSAAVYHFVGEGKGLVHEVWAARRPAAQGGGGQLEEILGNLTAEMVAGVRNTFLSVREYARAKLPHQTARLGDFNYAYKVTKEDEPSGGLSAGLPSALAFLSAFLDRPLPQDVASSGVLVADAHDVLVVRPVGEADLKVRGAYNRDLRLLLLPEGNRADLQNSPLVPRAVSDELVRFVSNLDQAVSLVFGEEVWLS